MEKRLLTNRFKQPGDDMKDEVRSDDDWHAWSIWSTTRDHFARLRQSGPLLQFPCEEGILSCIYNQVREEEQIISVQFLGSQQDVSTSRMKKRNKSRMILLIVATGPWLYPAEDEVRAGVICRQSWEPELVSSFHHNRSWTCVGVFVCLFGFVQLRIMIRWL